VGGSLVYCDPDQFPLPVRNDLEGARDRLPTIRADRQAFRAILEHEHLSSTAGFTPDELIAINENYKQIQAIELDPADDRYRFTVQAPGEGSSGIQRLTGIVDRWGAVMIERTEVGHTPNCPICLAAGVRIATPSGEIPVAELRVGMPVWTTDLSGRHIAGIVLEIGHMDAPLGHEVVRLELSDGRTVLASPGHPTADGGTVGQLEPGDRYQGAVVAGAMLVPYAGETWDLLPSGPSGTYFANGVPLDSSLSPHVQG
jgi:hypothetical protein